MMLWFMSRSHNKEILNNVIFAFKMSLLSERHFMTVVYIYDTCINHHIKDICYVSLIHTPSSKVLPRLL